VDTAWPKPRGSPYIKRHDSETNRPAALSYTARSPRHSQYHPLDKPPPYNHPKLIVSRLTVPSIATAGVNRMRFRVGFLLRDKDVPTQPRRPFGRVIVNKAKLLYGSILSPSFNRLPLEGRDTRIGSAGLTQKQTFGSCVLQLLPRSPGPS
jgi:hypothetical protein